MNETQALLERAERGPRRGPDEVWAAAQRRHRRYVTPARAAMVLFVAAAVAALALTFSRSDSSNPPVATTPPPDPTSTQVTATASGEQISTALSLDGPEFPSGATLTATATITNVSNEPITVWLDPDDLMTLRWDLMPAELLDAAHAKGLTGLDGGGVSLRDLDNLHGYTREEITAPPTTAELAPGESATIVGAVPIDDQVRTGSVTLRFTPRVAVTTPIETDTGQLNSAFRQPATIEIPLSIGPPANGTVTQADAEALALDDPAVELWLTTSHEGWTNQVTPGTRNIFGTFPSGDGWQVFAAITRDDASGEVPRDVRDFGRPGFIINVARNGTVTVDYMVN